MKRHSLLGTLGIAAAVGLSFYWQEGASGQSGTLSIEATKLMVKECREQHENVADTIEEVLVEMEHAQRSHDAARMRAVLELSRMKLEELKQEMALCTNLMNMIERRTTEHETTQHEKEEHSQIEDAAK
jgi:hypothetical protein